MRTSYAAVAAALGMVIAAPGAAAQTAGGPGTSRWFVELDGAPAADGTSRSALIAEQNRFKDAAKAAGISYRRHYSYSTLFNGVSIDAGDQAISEIRHLDGVAAVHPVHTVQLAQQVPAAFNPDLAYAITMTGVDIAQSRLGYTGRGVHVAIMDSGVDYDHPDLGGCFGRGCRVSTGYDFVGDDYDFEPSDPTWQPVPHPDPDPDDCFGHGTHVAGIVGADGGVRGVAPDVTFGAYRVFGCTGATADDVMLAAMERIYRDGADVLNMSIAEDLSGWPQAPTAQAATRLADKGVVVVAGAGNDRLDGPFAMGAPAVGEGVIAAASVDNLKQAVTVITISPDDRPVFYAVGYGTAPLPAGGTAELARTGTATTADDACAPLPAGSLAGKVALIRRGTCPFTDKGTNAAAAGATGIVFYNNAGGIDGSPTVTGVPIPAIYVSQADGELIDARLAAGPVSMKWGQSTDVPLPSAGLLSVFSSDGLAADLSLKPDIAAPGGFIRSTWPREKGGYAVLSGTSMSTPHVAGAAALYLQAHPRTPPRDVAAILQNSADPVPYALAPSLGVLDEVARQGAGLLDVDDAILATTEITPGKLSLGDGASARRTVTIANDGPQAVTYSLSNADGLALTGTDITNEGAANGPSAVAFSRRGRAVSAVSVPPRSRASVDVTIAPDAKLPDGAIYGGYLVFMPRPGDTPLRVPYAGYKGDYQAVPAMTPTSSGYPWLARQTGISVTPAVRPVYERQQDGAVFTLAPRTFTSGTVSRAGADTPFVLVHMNNYARRIRIEAVRGRVSYGEVYREDYVARNKAEGLLAPPSALAKAIPLDGTARRGGRRSRLPDGDYRLVMTVEKALADRWTPAERWTSPVLRIARTPARARTRAASGS
jgi:minor extracellular serine protease Vpr